VDECVTHEPLPDDCHHPEQVLNAVLFVLMGLEFIRLPLSRAAIVGGLLVIPVVLLGRLLSVAAPLAGLRRFIGYAKGTVSVLTWGGLRGGISIAMALSIPARFGHDLIVSMTYFVVTFSMLVQGLTLGRWARRFAAAPPPPATAP
jgi:CPA1 family monovalent cation:H+ antiporter